MEQLSNFKYEVTEGQRNVTPEEYWVEKSMICI